ncbi:SDR family oxidoreductase [Actinomadura violacea]|nr:NmrA family transcriptional regulator [Actinomadura violacea]
MITHDMTLVLGGTGQIGRRIVQRLTGRDLRVRIGSRSGGVPFDWTDTATWAPALDGVHAACIAGRPSIAAPAAIGAFARLAVASDARRLVLLSARGEPEAQARERALAASGADWTVLRAALPAQDFSEGPLLGPVLNGEVVLPAGAAEPFVDAADIADAAAAVLTEDGHRGRTYDLTGPRLLTFAAAVAAIAEATGRHIAFVPAPASSGRRTPLGDGVRQVLRRPPRDFTDYARDTAATGIWNTKDAA